MCDKTKCKNKKHFCKYCLQCFSSERILVEHRRASLKINGKTVKLRSSSIKFKNHMRFIDSLKQFLESMIIKKKFIKKHFNKNLFMPEKMNKYFS